MISSAQARAIIPEKEVKQDTLPEGSLSSHDALRQSVQSAQGQAQGRVQGQVQGPSSPEQVKEETVPEPSTVEAQTVPASEQPKPESPRFRDVRLRAETAERAAKEREQIIQDLLKSRGEQLHTHYEKPVAPAPDDDELVINKNFRPLMEEVQILKKQLNQYQQYTTVEQSRNALRQSLSDYDKVMTPDNLKDLEYMEPAIATALKTSQDFEGASKIAYHLIKNLGIYEDRVKIDPEEQKRRIDTNLAKPKPASVMNKSGTPLGEISPFHREQTKEHKDMVWARMQKKLRTKKSF